MKRYTVTSLIRALEKIAKNHPRAPVSIITHGSKEWTYGRIVRLDLIYLQQFQSDSDREIATVVLDDNDHE